MKELPVGLSKTNWGYRLHRTVNGKKYNFGSIQNHELAHRLNGYIDIIVADLKDAQSKEGVLSVDQIQKMIVENSVSDMEEITRQINDSNRHINRKFISLMEQNERLEESMSRRFDYEVGLLVKENKKLQNKIDSIVTVIQLEQQKTLLQKLRGR
jgi:hypothetical protein